MKKSLLISIFLLLAAFCLYGQADYISDEDDSSSPVIDDSKDVSSDIDFSYLNTNFLLTVPNTLSKYEYQNPAGDFFTNKQVKDMVLGISENEKLMKQYDGFMAATYTLLGIFTAGCVVNLVYNFNDNLPYKSTVMNINQYVSLMSFCGLVLTGNAARVRMKRAVDNYNLSLIP